MLGLLCIAVCVLGAQVSLAQSDTLGPYHVRATVGQLPIKYLPMTSLDEHSSAQGISLFSEILQTLPNVYSISIGPIDVNIPHLWLRGKIYVTNIVVRGLQNVALQHLEIRTRNNRIDFAALASQMSAEANFQLNGKLGAVPITLIGSLSLGIQDLNPAGAVGAKKVVLPGIGEVYQVDSGDVTLDVNSINLQIESASTDIDLRTKANVLDMIKDNIGDAVLIGALKEVNNELAKVPASTVEQMLHN